MAVAECGCQERQLPGFLWMTQHILETAQQQIPIKVEEAAAASLHKLASVQSKQQESTKTRLSRCVPWTLQLHSVKVNLTDDAFQTEQHEHSPLDER